MRDALTCGMSLPPAQWMEIGFDVSYLAVISALVALMTARLAGAAPSQQELLRRFRDGFLFLAIGDTGHVGFRVVALLRGGLETKVELAGASVPLVGVGALMTAITVTFLYMVLLDAWRIRFNQPRQILFWWLMSLGVVRLLLFIPAQNQWGQVMPPLDWSIARNVPLAVLGLTVAGLMIRHGRRAVDTTFTWLGALILVSYAFYVPVILFVQRWAAIGVLMIPKTLAYLAMAGLVYARLFKPHGSYDTEQRGQAALLPGLGVGHARGAGRP